MNAEILQIRVHGLAGSSTVVYLPGLHGDWTLIAGLRMELSGRVRLVEFTYPRTVSWSIADYAKAIRSALIDREIRCVWLLAESWGSQVAWQILKQESHTPTEGAKLQIEGLVLAGGFVKHPWSWGPGLLLWLARRTPVKLYRFGLSMYIALSAFFNRRQPGVVESLTEFGIRRTVPDREAMLNRLELLADFDPRSIAQATKVPVFHLSGLVDPLIPWPLVRRWLRTNCPGYRQGRICWLADHAVLASAPKRSAEYIIGWIGSDTCSS